jgi:peptide/nickel transport system permease protein
MSDATRTAEVSGIVNKKNSRARRYDVASHWQLMWWKFKRHHMAILGLSLLSVFLVISLVPEFLSPYKPHTRNLRYAQGPPMGIHFFDSDGVFHARPFIYGWKSKRDPVTLRRITTTDESKRYPLQLFIKGEKYKLLFLFDSDIHLFGVQSSKIHLFGTDQIGRDVFSRTLYATRTSLSIGFIGVMIAFMLGLVLGGISGYTGGLVDLMIMRVVEFIRSIPTLPLWLALAAALPRDWSTTKVYIAITMILAMIGWTHLARRVRGKLLALREEDFVLAARLSGCSHSRIIGHHMLPSFMSYLIVDLTISFPYIILAETALSFLGLGMREPTVSWGVLLFSAQNVRSLALMPWLLIPGLFVVVAVLAFNFVGDGARDAADPYAK